MKFFRLFFAFSLFLFVFLVTVFFVRNRGDIFGTKDSPIQIAFVGDLMFDRYIRQIAQDKGYEYILEDVRPLFLEKDFVVGNLEGPITTNQSVSIYSEIGSPPNFVFTFDPVVAPTLKNHNVQVVSIGNNHILNMDWAGLDATRNYLDKVGIEYFGNTGAKNDKRILIKEIKGVKLGFVNYNQFVGEKSTLVFEDISKVKDQVDLVVLCAHWGPEYVTTSPQYIQDLAHDFIDAGVDFIIGGHPHVIQQKEVYKGKTIYYSLGNFVMDQYFSEETQKGMLVEITIHPKNLSMEFTERYVQMDMSGRTKLTSM